MARRTSPPHVQRAIGAAVGKLEDRRPRARRIEVTLPFPPSTNHAYRLYTVGGRARMGLTSEGRAFKERVGRIVWAHLRERGVAPPGPPYSLLILAYPPDRRKHDIDNLTKLTVDGLFSALEGANDNDLLTLRSHKLPPSGDARAEIVLEGEGDE